MRSTPNLRGAGLALAVLLLGAVPAAILAHDWRALNRVESVLLEQSKNRLLLRTYDHDTAVALGACPATAAYFAVFLLLLTPLAAMVFATPRATLSDLSGGRFFVRLGRAARALGATVAQTLTALTVVYAAYATWAWFVLARDVARASLTWLPRLWVTNATYALAFLGLASLVRATTRSPASATAAALGAVTALCFVRAVARTVGSPLASALPNGLDGLLLQHGVSLRAVLLASAWTLGSVVAGVAVASHRRAS